MFVITQVIFYKTINYFVPLRLFHTKCRVAQQSFVFNLFYCMLDEAY